MNSFERFVALLAIGLFSTFSVTGCGGSSGEKKEPGAPTAIAGEDQVVSGGARVTLDGTSSFDDDGVIVMWYWEQTKGAEVVLEDDFSGRASFTAPAATDKPQELSFRLTVMDDEGKYDTDTVKVTVAPPGSGGGSPVGFGVLHDGPIQPENFVVSNGRAFFAAFDEDDTGINSPDREQLWVSDGTHAGTRRIADFGKDGVNGYIHILGAFRNGVVFTGYDGTVTGGLWFSDGTEAGTYLIKDPATTTAENIDFIGVGGNHFYFMADDGVHGRELWASDGTPAGTYMIRDVNPNGDTYIERPQAATYYNGGFYVYLWYYETGGYAYPKLYRTDGTQGNLVVLADSSVTGSVLLEYDMAVFDDKLYFTWHDVSRNSKEVWVTDGTPGGTHAVITPYTVPGYYGWPTAFHVLDDRLLFFGYAVNGGAHKALWSTNGTAAGTQVISQGAHYADTVMVKMNGRYYYPGRDYASNRLSLWVTDGSSAGTYKVHDVEPADGSRGMMAVMGNRLVFRGSDGVHGYEPWVSDGTTAGTFMLKDIHPETGSFTVNGGVMTVRGNKAYFVAGVSNTDFQLFETDGTMAGTRIIAPDDATVTVNPMGQRIWTEVELAAPTLLGNTLLFNGKFHGKYRLYVN